MNHIKRFFTHRVTIWILIFIVGFLSGGVFVESEKPHYKTPEWAIISDFDAEELPEKATSVFDARVKEEFPEGMFEKKLIHTLMQAGFEMDWYTPHGSKAAYLLTKESGCEIDRQIVWTKNTQNKITAINGTYWKSCKKKRDRKRK